MLGIRQITIQLSNLNGFLKVSPRNWKWYSIFISGSSSICVNFTNSQTDGHLALFTFCAFLYLCMVIMYGHVCSCVVMCGHVWSCVVMYGHVWSCKLMYHVWSILVMYDKYNQVWSCVVKYIYAWSCMEMHSCIRSCMVNGHVWCWVKYGRPVREGVKKK